MASYKKVVKDLLQLADSSESDLGNKIRKFCDMVAELRLKEGLSKSERKKILERAQALKDEILNEADEVKSNLMKVDLFDF